MTLHFTRKGPGDAALPIVCVHGVGQDGSIFGELSDRLAGKGAEVISVDLRGHGRSTREPPWDTGTLVRDLEATSAALEVDAAIWIGHSYGARLIAALAAENPSLVRGMALLDPPTDVPPAHAIERVEVERLDWSFDTYDGAVGALLGFSVQPSARPAIEAYVKRNMVRGPDHRLRFNFSPGAAVVAWSDMVHPHPIAGVVEALVVRPSSGPYATASPERYRELFGPQVKVVSVPHGHNVLWEAPDETGAAIEDFLTIW
jgi:lipase